MWVIFDPPATAYLVIQKLKFCKMQKRKVKILNGLMFFELKTIFHYKDITRKRPQRVIFDPLLHLRVNQLNSDPPALFTLSCAESVIRYSLTPHQRWMLSSLFFVCLGGGGHMQH